MQVIVSDFHSNGAEGCRFESQTDQLKTEILCLYAQPAVKGHLFLIF